MDILNTEAVNDALLALNSSVAWFFGNKGDSSLMGFLEFLVSLLSLVMVFLFGEVTTLVSIRVELLSCVGDMIRYE